MAQKKRQQTMKIKGIPIEKNDLIESGKLFLLSSKETDCSCLKLNRKTKLVSSSCPIHGVMTR